MSHDEFCACPHCEGDYGRGPDDDLGQLVESLRLERDAAQAECAELRTLMDQIARSLGGMVEAIAIARDAK